MKKALMLSSVASMIDQFNMENIKILKSLGYEDTPQTFLWHTFTDDCVPVQNSLVLVDALLKNKIPTEFHMYPSGGHGLGLANKCTANPGGYGIKEECATWMELLRIWLENYYPIEFIM